VTTRYSEIYTCMHVYMWCIKWIHNKPLQLLMKLYLYYWYFELDLKIFTHDKTEKNHFILVFQCSRERWPWDNQKSKNKRSNWMIYRHSSSKILKFGDYGRPLSLGLMTLNCVLRTSFIYQHLDNQRKQLYSLKSFLFLPTHCFSK
jgi:hypothetical protein